MWPKDYEDQHKVQMSALAKVLMPVLCVVGIAVGIALAVHQNKAEAQVRPSPPDSFTQFEYKAQRNNVVQVNTWISRGTKCTAVSTSAGNVQFAISVSCIPWG